MRGEMEGGGGAMDEDKQPLVAALCMYLQMCASVCVCVFTHLIACLWDAEVGASIF